MITKKDNKIVVIGYSATGKTTLTNVISQIYTEYKIFHTDDYQEYGFEGSLYTMMLDLEVCTSPKILVEGIQGARLLRKGVQQNSFFADLIIIVEASMATRARRYKEQRLEPDKISNLVGFDKTLDKIFNDYQTIIKSYFPKRLPRIVRVNTDKN
jgi:GTPase SAR1 family protein